MRGLVWGLALGKVGAIWSLVPERWMLHWGVLVLLSFQL